MCVAHDSILTKIFDQVSIMCPSNGIQKEKISIADWETEETVVNTLPIN